MTFSEVQSRALDVLEDNITTSLVYGGGAGGGKSYVGCYWILKMCIKYEGTRWLIGRKTRANLVNTTLNSFWQVCKMMGYERDVHFVYRETQNKISFHNGSEILLMDLDHNPSDPQFDRLGGLELTGAFVDECNEISELAWSTLKIRIRYKLDENGLIPKILGTCNPAKNWVYSQYYKPSLTLELPVEKQFIQALVTDNPNISITYIKQLMDGPKQLQDRMLYGKWETDDDSALVDYDSIEGMFDKSIINEMPRYYITCDVARLGSDKAVIMVWKGLEMIEMETFSRSLIPELQTAINKWKTRYSVSNVNIVIDGDGVGGGLVDLIRGSYDFRNGSATINKTNHANLKTQCYYKLCELINAGKIGLTASLTLDEKKWIIQELEQVRYKEANNDGKLMIMSKKEIKAAIGRSPDYSDAMMMRMAFELGSKAVHGSQKFR